MEGTPVSIFATWLLPAEDGDSAAPVVYQGSHVNPADDHPRAGWLEVAAVPNHCHPDVRGEVLDERSREGTRELPVEFLRMSPGQSSETYAGSRPGQATVILDRSHAERLHDMLGDWLSTTERWEVGGFCEASRSGGWSSTSTNMMRSSTTSRMIIPCSGSRVTLR
jgi:hypothetical protein